MAAPPRVSILSNNLPNPKDRSDVDGAIRRALADRTGDWRASIVEPHNASFWQLSVQGPANFNWVRRFDGPDEQRAEYVESQLRAAVAEVPTFAAITRILDAKWTQPNTCPICGTSEWSVSEIPYALPQMGGERVMPLYPASCTNCGYVIFFNAILAGLLNES